MFITNSAYLESYRSEFVQQVPLLAELLDSALSAIAFRGGAALAFDFDSAVAGAGASVSAGGSRGNGGATAQRRVRQSAKASQGSDEEDSEEELDEDSDASDADRSSTQGRRSANVSSVPAVERRQVSARSSKALASTRISQQIGDENAENIALRVSSEVPAF
jgi:hypothetical protein